MSMQSEQKAMDENTGKVQFPVGHDGFVSRTDELLRIAREISRYQSLEK